MSATAEDQTYEERLQEARDARAESEQIAGQQDLAGGEVDGGAAPVVDEVSLEGTVQLDLFGMGGKKATAATLTVRGKTVELPAGRGYAKGQRVRVEGYIVIDSAGDTDKRDKATGMVTDCVRKLSGFWDGLEISAVEV